VRFQSSEDLTNFIPSRIASVLGCEARRAQCQDGWAEPRLLSCFAPTRRLPHRPPPARCREKFLMFEPSRAPCISLENRDDKKKSERQKNKGWKAKKKNGKAEKNKNTTGTEVTQEKDPKGKGRGEKKQEGKKGGRGGKKKTGLGKREGKRGREQTNLRAGRAVRPLVSGAKHERQARPPPNFVTLRASWPRPTPSPAILGV